MSAVEAMAQSERTTVPAARGRKGGRKTVSKADETAHEKFLRLAPPRVEAALKKIDLIGNLARPGYHCEPDEARKIISALTKAVDEVAAKFNRSKSGSKGGFSF